jgi:UDP-N-acetylmuramoyl-tripeptide--D-alanyl-D-alanine ligase
MSTDDSLLEMAQLGASAAVVSKRVASQWELMPPLPLLVVDDTFKALNILAAASRERFSGKITAITGVAGKTSTRTILSHILQFQAPTTSTIGNRNYGPGLWLALIQSPPDAAFGVYEISMLGPRSIAAKAKLFKPDVGVITNLGIAHLQYHQDIKSIVKTKADIVEGIAPKGSFIIPRDTVWYEYLLGRGKERGVEILSFGEHPLSDIRLVSAKYGPSGSDLIVSIRGQDVRCAPTVPGKHIAQNILASLAAVHALEADVERAAADLSSWRPPAGRSHIQDLKLANCSVQIIDDSFNANPVSMKAAIELLGLVVPKAGGRRIAVLADMLELGAQSAELHRQLALPLVQQNIDKVLTQGQHVQALRNALPVELLGPHADNPFELTCYLDAVLKEGDVVLVKGSHSTHVMGVVSALKFRDKSSAIVTDVSRRSVIYEHAGDAPRLPASLAKLMTLYLVFSSIRRGDLALEEIIEVSTNAAKAPVESSTMGCCALDKVSVRDIIRGLIVRSANDAAVAIAEHISGSETSFVDLMNSTAASVGLTSTYFANASGLHKSRSQTTARDMGKLAHAIVDDFPEFLPYFSEKTFEFRSRSYDSRNELLGNYAGLKGMKTGHVPASGFHLVALAERDQRQIITVVMGAETKESRDDRSRRLLDLGFAALQNGTAG